MNKSENAYNYSILQKKIDRKKDSLKFHLNLIIGLQMSLKIDYLSNLIFVWLGRGFGVLQAIVNVFCQCTSFSYVLL